MTSVGASLRPSLRSAGGCSSGTNGRGLVHSRTNRRDVQLTRSRERVHSQRPEPRLDSTMETLTWLSGRTHKQKLRSTGSGHLPLSKRTHQIIYFKIIDKSNREDNNTALHYYSSQKSTCIIDNVSTIHYTIFKICNV